MLSHNSPSFMVCYYGTKLIVDASTQKFLLQLLKKEALGGSHSSEKSLHIFGVTIAETEMNVLAQRTLEAEMTQIGLGKKGRRMINELLSHLLHSSSDFRIS